jgi:hypothetical protein
LIFVVKFKMRMCFYKKELLNCLKSSNCYSLCLINYLMFKKNGHYSLCGFYMQVNSQLNDVCGCFSMLIKQWFLCSFTRGKNLWEVFRVYLIFVFSLFLASLLQNGVIVVAFGLYSDFSYKLFIWLSWVLFSHLL